MDRFFVTPDMDMPMEDILSGSQYAENVNECARLCDQNNATLRYSQPPYGFGHCNAFVYDTERKQCTLKNKAAGNFDPVQGAPTFCKPSKTYAGYRWNALVNEINDPFPNRTSGMQYNPLPARVAWSHDSMEGAKTVLVAPGQQGAVYATQVPLKSFDVRPGAIFSTQNAQPVKQTQPFRVSSMQECANAVKFDANAFTFRPDYTSQSATRAVVGGMCVVGTVREPYYQTLTERDNGAISGFLIQDMAPTTHRFLFG